jgi:hypothetical protein
VQHQRMAGQLTALHLQMAATLFKDPAFKNEDEWRLVTRQLWENGKEVKTPTTQGGPTRYRAIGGRVVAYETLDLTLRPPALKELVLGYSCPRELEDVSLSMLLGTAGATVTIRRSTVPVRR